MSIEKFSTRGYHQRYEKKLGVQTYTIGYYYNSRHDVAVFTIPKTDLFKYCPSISFEALSPANIERMRKRDGKKHLRMKANATLLKKAHIDSLGGFEPELIPAEVFEQARDRALELKGQRNRGYALELLLTGTTCGKGIDRSDFDDEIKFMNGQIELY